MSFGFKKKLLPTHKKNAFADGTDTNDNKTNSTTNLNETKDIDDGCYMGDSNGNSGEFFD